MWKNSRDEKRVRETLQPEDGAAPRGRRAAGARVLLLSWDALNRCVLSEGLQRRGHQVTALSSIEEVLTAAQVESFDVALLLVPANVAPVLLQKTRAFDADLEVLWSPSPLRVSEADAMISQAAERGQRRLRSVVDAVQTLLKSESREGSLSNLLAQARLLLDAEVSLHAGSSTAPATDRQDGGEQLSSDRRTLRITLERAPCAQGSGGRPLLVIQRGANDAPLSAADLARARLLVTVGAMALDENQALEHAALGGRGQDVPGRTDVASTGLFAQLAGMLAHELNNPLTLVMANLTYVRETLESLREEVADDAAAPHCEDALEVLTEIHCGAARIREIVRELTTAGHRRSQLLAVEDVVRAVMGIGERALRRRARVVVELAPRLPAVRGAAGSLVQLLLNLLLNAVQAVPGAACEREPPRVVLRAEALVKGGHPMVALRVIDNGPGIAPEVLPRLFEAGFTTKATGSGLGLAICRQIAEAHGGEMLVESQLGRGTTMTVLLPAAEPSVRLRGAARNKPLHPQAG